MVLNGIEQSSNGAGGRKRILRKAEAIVCPVDFVLNRAVRHGAKGDDHWAIIWEGLYEPMRIDKPAIARCDVFGTSRWQVLVNGVLYDFQKRDRAIDGANLELMEQLHHEPIKALDSARDTHGRVYVDEHIL